MVVMAVSGCGSYGSVYKVLGVLVMASFKKCMQLLYLGCFIFRIMF